MTNQGTTSLLSLAQSLREKSEHIRSFFDHGTSADLMLRAAAAIERLAPLDPEIEVEKGEN